jgi:[ribosomal protein S5]-alanine N-acetyltransferase
MKIFKKTERLILREITPEDTQGLWELDSDVDVHKYLGNNPINSIEQCKGVIEFIRQQYFDNGIGRWAMVEKKTNKFVGWAGLKLIKEEINGRISYYDLGYRLIKQFWGQGFATEASVASLEFGFEQLNLKEIYAFADSRNKQSIHVLKKVGLQFKEKFNFKNIEHDWFEITYEDWIKREPTANTKL